MPHSVSFFQFLTFLCPEGCLVNKVNKNLRAYDMHKTYIYLSTCYVNVETSLLTAPFLRYKVNEL